MPYQRIKPTQTLRPYVEGIWVQEDPVHATLQQCRPTKVVPTGTIELVFNFRDPFVHIEGNQLRTVPRCYITGQRTKPLDVMATGRTGIVIVSFFPWGAAPFWDLPVDRFNDGKVALGDTAKANALAELSERLYEANSSIQRVRLVEAFLLGSLDERRYDTLVTATALRINESSGTLSIDRLARDMHISRRQLVRRFKAAVGLSPKQFAKVNRFQKALYLNQLGVAWSEIVDLCRYYDQAHFIKEVRSFTGLSPQKLFCERTATPLMRFFNRHSKTSLFYNTVYL